MARRRIRTFALILAFFSVALPGARPAFAAGPDDFIRDMAKDAIESLADQEIDSEERERRFRDIIKRAFDMRVVARFALGRYWRVASKPQREEYLGLFEDYIVKTYAARLKLKNGKNFRVGKTLVINKLDKLVLSEIAQPKGQPVKLNWRVRGDNDYRIVDVIVEGISMGITQRDEFASVIRNKGGKLEGLLSALREKTGRK